MGKSTMATFLKKMYHGSVQFKQYLNENSPDIYEAAVRNI